MKRYLLLLRRGDLKLGSPQGEEALRESFGCWAEGLAKPERDLVVGPLKEEGNYRVRKSADRLVIDGPVAVSRELVLGVFIFNAVNEGEVARLVESCPGLRAGAELEVRELSELPGMSPLDDAG